MIHAKLADEYGIGIGDIKKDEAKIRSFASIICECLDYFTRTWCMYIQSFFDDSRIRPFHLSGHSPVPLEPALRGGLRACNNVYRRFLGFPVRFL